METSSVEKTRPAAPARAVDQAAALGISEAEWLLHQDAAKVTRLKLPAAEILKRVPELGVVMALTRNPSCVHEKDGAYDHLDIGPAMGLVLNHDIDLRLFMTHWAFAFAVETPLEKGGVRHSIQFFDKAGIAIHKIFARPVTNMDAWGKLVADFTDADASGPLHVVAYPPKSADRADAEIDVEALRAGWWKLADVHDFFALLKKQGVGRQQAMRLVGDPFARRIDPAVVKQLLEEAASTEVPIMCFVGNRGCIQIHSGQIHRVVEMGPWLNVLDPGFNLHLRADQIAAAYAVWKPQTDSAVHSIELFDETGELVCQFFGERKPGKPELESWKALVAAIPAQIPAQIPSL